MTIEVPSSPAPIVSVIIPTKTLELVLCALRSLVDAAPIRVAFETIVVVNGAASDLARDLRSRVAGVQIVESTLNRGLAGAANLGRRVARGQLLVLLHDDAEVEPGWMEAFVAAADEFPDAGAIGGMVLDPDGSLQTAGMVLWQDATVSPPWLGDPPSPESFAEPRAVDYCGSSAILVRAEVWDSIGGLEERLFPAYYVDVDLAMSVRAVGWRVLFHPGPRIRHRRGASSTARTREFLAQRNRAFFIEKWSTQLAGQPPNDGDVLAAVQRAADRPPTPHSAAGQTLRTEVLGEDAYVTMAHEVQVGLVRYLDDSLDRSELALHALAATVAAAEAELERLRATFRYRLGTTLDFCAGGSAHCYRHHGGYAPEEWGQWLGAAPFELILPLDLDIAPSPESATFTLELEALSYLDSNRTMSPFTVMVNGRVVVAMQETEAGLHRYTATVPAVAVDAAGGQLVVRIEAAAAARPSGPFAADDRSLSVGLVAVTLGWSGATALSG